MFKPMRILSLSFRGKAEDAVWNTVLEEAAGFKPDLVLLPEAWLGDDYPKEKCSAVLANAAVVARQLGCYVVCPLYRLTEAACRNSAFVLDATGTVVSTSDKIFPWWYEFSASPGCESGGDARPFDTPFGRLCCAICFDVNFPRVWQRMEALDVDLVLWPSDYSAGRALQAHAITNHYYIVSATRYPDTALCDISGDELFYNATPGADSGIVTGKYVVDLDRQIFHENFNMEKRAALLEEYPDIYIDREFKREQWFILASRSGKQSVKEAARKFEMETLRAYLRRSGRTINAAWAS
jgi:predicted amidohydrolase